MKRNAKAIAINANVKIQQAFIMVAGTVAALLNVVLLAIM